MDTIELAEKITSFRDYSDVLDYINATAPAVFCEKITLSYAKRFLYTYAGHYKEVREYDAQNILYNLTHKIIRAATHGR